ncbi:signal transduction histidine kinase [Sinobacterium caligoides]|uniref:histidine kinase n=1 Tax=Sinobacterium caligoides TaxID=933926 RepID=A0A3N2DN00_9GAMM|nr:HAMP domain-containing sensor histidine kinase [Sinobacterium caligoides]ROS01187.1 signal transduction histidine kinase [Sinobacterium caligoides]
MKSRWSKLSISNRLIFSLVSLVAIISGIFALSIYVSVHVVENTLITREMNLYLRTSLAKERPLIDNVSGVDYGQSELEVYTSANVPPSLGQFPYGLSELERSDRDYYVYKKQRSAEVYYLVMDQGNFEDVESLFYYIIYALYLGCVLLSWMIARWLSASIIRPISKLDKAVSEKMRGQDSSIVLHEGNANDEVGRLARSFDSLITQYDESLAREQLFNADVSHELKTPLMVIATSVEMLEEVGGLSAYQEAKLRTIRDACAEVDDLSSTFLLLLKHNYDDGTEPIETDLETVIDQLDYKWRPLVETKELKFSLENHCSITQKVPEGTTMIVLNNLLKNALNYTLQGEVRIDFYNDYWVVSDSGVGISEIDQGQLYHAFRQANNSGRSEGFGLGLSIARRVCDLYGWRLDYQSNTLGGTSFTVSLSEGNFPGNDSA